MKNYGAIKSDVYEKKIIDLTKLNCGSRYYFISVPHVLFTK